VDRGGVREDEGHGAAFDGLASFGVVPHVAATLKVPKRGRVSGCGDSRAGENEGCAVVLGGDVVVVDAPVGKVVGELVVLAAPRRRKKEEGGKVLTVRWSRQSI
jgi:hypothetical protein